MGYYFCVSNASVIQHLVLIVSILNPTPVAVAGLSQCNHNLPLCTWFQASSEVLQWLFAVSYIFNEVHITSCGIEIKFVLLIS